MKALAVIPARGGSKRIPQKNIIDFNGKPMIAWTVEAAIKSSLFDRVLVSTDTEEIAAVGRCYGGEAPFLREEKNDDVSPVSEATIAAVVQAEAYWKEEYDVVVQLMPNCPNRNAKDIRKSIEHFEHSKADFQISCFKYGWMNPWWACKLSDSNKPEFLFKEALKKRSQDLEDLYCPTGAIWIADKIKLLDQKTFYGKEHIFYPIDWKSAVDIDDYSDLDFSLAVLDIVKNRTEKGSNVNK